LLTPLLDVEFQYERWGAELSHDGSQIATIGNGDVLLYDLVPPDPIRPARMFDIDDHDQIESLLSDAVFSPIDPLLVVLDGGIHLTGWDTSTAGFDFVGALRTENGVSLRGGLQFNEAGTRIIGADDGNAAVVQVTPGFANLFVEDGDWGYSPAAVARFFGPDDGIVVTEDAEAGILRFLAPVGGGIPTWGNARRVQVSDLVPTCGEILCLAAATGQPRIAVCCSGGGLLIIDDPVSAEPRIFTLSSGFRPFEAAALARNGSLAAAVAGETLHVWQASSASALPAKVAVGLASDSYPLRVCFDPAAARVAVDREKRLVVHAVEIP
jgi:hypothetical protein